MTLSIEWTLENRPTPLQVRVTAVLRFQRPGPEVEELSAVDEQGRPVALTDAEDWELQLLAMERAEGRPCPDCGECDCGVPQEECA